MEQPYQQIDIGSRSVLDRQPRRADVGVRRRANVTLLIGPTSGRRVRRADVGPTLAQRLLPAFPQRDASAKPNTQASRCENNVRPMSSQCQVNI